MLAVELNRANFEYDVHSIVKAFYPEEQVSVLTPEMGEEKRADLAQWVRIRILLRDNGALVAVDGEEYDWKHTEGHTGGKPEAGAAVGEPPEKAYKYGFKCFLYRVLSRVTGRELPWGNLTGIRPTKIAFSLLEQGREKAELVKHYMEKYYVSREKAELAVEIAGRELELLKGISHGKTGGERGYSLYVGIPFCPTTCLYCSFTSFPIGAYRGMTDSYLDCLIREVEYVAERYRERILDSVYIGGGTPTTLEAWQLDRLLGRLRELFDFSAVKEFTVEAGRADSITEEKLQALQRHGVTRISINPQTMKQQTLDFIGRKATVEQVETAYALARRMGFDNINMDLILGLPGESEADVQATMDRVVEMAPDSLTVHSLAVKRASRLNQMVQEIGTHMLRNTDETMRIAEEGARRLGLVPYYLYRQKNMSGNFENVGYAKEGKLGLYNILIMEERQTIIALGAGSISKLVLPDGRIERSENVKEVNLYIEKIGEMIARKERLFQLEEN